VSSPKHLTSSPCPSREGLQHRSIALEGRLPSGAALVDDQGCRSTRPRPGATNSTRLGRQSVSTV
jgi:hypothetical protein